MEAVIGGCGKHGARERQEEGLPQDLARKSPLQFVLPSATIHLYTLPIIFKGKIAKRSDTRVSVANFIA